MWYKYHFSLCAKEARDTPPGLNITRIDILAHARSVFIRAYRQCGGGDGGIVLRARRAALCSNGESDNRVCVSHKTAHAVNAPVCVCWEPLAAVGAGGRNVQRVKHVHHVSYVNRYISDTRFCVGEACSRAHTRQKFRMRVCVSMCIRTRWVLFLLSVRHHCTMGGSIQHSQPEQLVA